MLARYQMFTQVYFHKTRRAFDYHLRKAMKSVLSNGMLPELDEIEEFIYLDDMVVWNKIKEKKDDPNCKAILKRNHIRKVYSTSETPTKKDEEYKEEQIKKLNMSDIWFYEDKAEALWYEINTDEETKEIMIISDKERQTCPQSSYSSIVKNMGKVKQIRIYVKPEDVEKAKRELYG